VGVEIDMKGKVVVVTGASSGIGAVAARRLAERGAAVVPIGRSAERTAETARAVGAEPVVADFARLADVRRAAQEVLERCPHIDVLANNAGLVVPRRTVTEDGREMTFQINHLAPFLLTALLLPRLRESAQRRPVRVITTSSFGNVLGRIRFDDLEWERRRYGGGLIVYCASKLMNILFTRELARRTVGSGIHALAFHPRPSGEPYHGPDVTYTRLVEGTTMARLLDRVPAVRSRVLTGQDGAGPLLHLATAREVAPSGTYYDGLEPGGRVHRQADDRDLAACLWERSTELVAPVPDAAV
jgi:NAD(P)-dependent dehydrogenase (short-subunit alcohol dehydrogenase family)